MSLTIEHLGGVRETFNDLFGIKKLNALLFMFVMHLPGLYLQNRSQWANT